MILEKLTSLNDLKALSINELNELANEIRERIIQVMSVNGGHLGSNLGAIELTIALHKVFDSPNDKFIWDVSHQTYTHKILTERNKDFSKIRQYKGLCGFSNPKESPHDHFYAGHAGTAMSLALGVAKNRDLTGRKETIIPVIGDATLTCGMSLEALNNISKNLKNFMVILNDNNMSISQNVGAITHILSRFLSSPTSNKLYHELENIVSKIPSVGPALSRQGHKLTESMKNLVSPAAFFEQFHLSYVGPVDGHSIEDLVDTFERLKGLDYPVLLHVMTKKGKGMEEAIKNPTPYHGAKPFDVTTGKFLPVTSNKPTFPKIFGQQILKIAENDPSVVAVTPAMSCGSCLDEFMAKFPDRCLDVGIAEAHSVTFAGGISYGGRMKVVASVYATFLQRAFDNLFHDVCLQELPVVFAIDRAGISGPDGSTHHGIYDISFLNAMPNMVITQPRDGRVLRELLNSSFSYGRPTAIRYPNLSTDDSEPKQLRELGKGEILREGSELLIVALGHMNSTALKVADELEKAGIKATVLDPVFVKPLDTDLLCSLLMTHTKIVTIEEHSAICGLGSIINHFLMGQGYQNVQVLNLGIPETFIEQGSHAELLKEIGLDVPQITNKIIKQFNYANCFVCQPG